MSGAETVLELDAVSVFYGQVCAVREVSLTVERGEVVTVLGANGAGKTTLMRAIAGLHRPRGGTVRYCGEACGGRPAHERARRGLVLAPEGRGLFPRLTVEENLKLGGWGTGKAAGERLEEMLSRFERLAERRTQVAGSLSGGEQQMLCVARAMMRRPEVLLLDEPSMGLAPRMVGEVYDLLRELRGGGMTLVIVEQNVGFALELADRGYVLTRGSVAVSGTVDQLRAEPAVLEAYLGGQGPEVRERVR